MKKILEIETVDGFIDWQTTTLPAGAYYYQQQLHFYRGDNQFPVQIYFGAEEFVKLKDASDDDFLRKSAIVRMLTETQSEQESGLLQLHLYEILSATEIYHILAACKLVAQVTGKPFTLPKDLVEIKELIEGLGKEEKLEEQTLAKDSYTYNQLCNQLSFLLNGRPVTIEEVNKAIESIFSTDGIEKFYTIGDNLRRNPLYNSHGDWVVDFPVKEKWNELLEAVKKVIA